MNPTLDDTFSVPFPIREIPAFPVSLGVSVSPRSVRVDHRCDGHRGEIYIAEDDRPDSPATIGYTAARDLISQILVYIHPDHGPVVQFGIPTEVDDESTTFHGADLRVLKLADVLRIIAAATRPSLVDRAARQVTSYFLDGTETVPDVPNP